MIAKKLFSSFSTIFFLFFSSHSITYEKLFNVGRFKILHHEVGKVFSLR